MKKRVWSRIISIILTFAMAFSLFATPVSAASENWAVPDEQITESGLSYVAWYTKAWFYDYVEENYPSLTDTQIEEVLDKVAAEYEGYLWDKDIPSNAYVGVSFDVNSSQVFWYTKGVWEIMKSCVSAGYTDYMDATNGMFVFSNGTKVYPIGYTGDRNSTNSWAVVGEAEGYGTLFMTESYFRKLWMEEKGLTGTDLEIEIIAAKNGAAEEGTLYTDTFPSDAMWGFSPSGSSEIFWYAEDFDTLETWDDGDFDPDTGVWTGSNGEKIYPINYVASTPSSGNNNPSTSSGNNSSSGDDGGAALLLLAGGVAVTATVVYLMNRAVLTADNITHNFFNGEKSLVIISDTVSDSAKAQIQSVAAGQKLAYFDVNCANLQNSIELIVPVKTFLRSNFKVYRVVNGTAAELKRLDAYPTDNASRIDGSYYVSGGTIYIYSSQPAEYAVGYNGL